MPDASFWNTKIFFILTLVWGICQQTPALSPTQTQSQINRLNDKINTVQHSLTEAKDQHEVFDKQLSLIEKQISTSIVQLHAMNQNKVIKEHQIASLQHSINELTQQIQKQQNLLASHVRARYQMGEYQPLKWLLNQEKPYQISRILTYYQYMVRSRQQLIDRIDTNRKKLDSTQKKLRQEVAEAQQLNIQLSQHQQQLQHNKAHQTSLIHSLDQEIQHNQHALHDFQKNKDNLTQLLNTLSSQQSIIPSHTSFAQMHRKLPHPLQTPQSLIQKMNQGVAFFATEGTPVAAVYPGKVVFSDWLKGYGLLLILDHGQGFMTLYAHNQSLFKRKGQHVDSGEQIATVGHSGGIKQNGLYFEIRQRGKAISPLEWLS